MFVNSANLMFNPPDRQFALGDLILTSIALGKDVRLLLDLTTPPGLDSR